VVVTVLERDGTMSGTEYGFNPKMERRNGGGCLILFGLPFLAAGIFMILTAAGVSGVPIDEDMPALFLFAFGLVFGGAGAALMFGRSGITIDRTSMQVTKWWGFMVPMKTTRYDLTRFDRVTVGKEVRSDSNSSKMVFPVRLAGSAGIDDLEYDAPVDYPAARRLSEDLARYTGLDIEDSMSGRKVMRQVGDLDETVRQRHRRTRERIPLPDPPWELTSTISDEVEGTVVDIPPPGLTPANLAPLIPVLFFGGMVGLFFLPSLLRANDSHGTQIIFGGFLGFFFILLPVATALGQVLRKTRHRVTVTASQKMLRVEQGVGRRRKVVEIAGTDLEEFELVGKKKIFEEAISENSQERDPTGDHAQKIRRLLAPDSMLGRLARMAMRSEIVARSDTVTIRFGRDLPEDELLYLHAILLRALT